LANAGSAGEPLDGIPIGELPAHGVIEKHPHSVADFGLCSWGERLIAFDLPTPELCSGRLFRSA
jgi:hypothetical protein